MWSSLFSAQWLAAVKYWEVSNEVPSLLAGKEITNRTSEPYRAMRNMGILINMIACAYPAIVQMVVTYRSD